MYRGTSSWKKQRHSPKGLCEKNLHFTLLDEILYYIKTVLFIVYQMVQEKRYVPGPFIRWWMNGAIAEVNFQVALKFLFRQIMTMGYTNLFDYLSMQI
jgi:hypothetical protein